MKIYGVFDSCLDNALVDVYLYEEDAEACACANDYYVKELEVVEKATN